MGRGPEEARVQAEVASESSAPIRPGDCRHLGSMCWPVGWCLNERRKPGRESGREGRRKGVRTAENRQKNKKAPTLSRKGQESR